MTARTCPNWPSLMELDPDLQFKHYTVVEARLPAEALARVPHASLAEIEICCDREKHVFNPEHTDPDVSDALRDTHWFDLNEWATSGPGASANGPSATSLDSAVADLDLDADTSNAA